MSKLISDETLYHYGILGQKWGERRYQYEDGSLTPEGRVRYGVGERRKDEVNDDIDKNLGDFYINYLDFLDKYDGEPDDINYKNSNKALKKNIDDLWKNLNRVKIHYDDVSLYETLKKGTPFIVDMNGNIHSANYSYKPSKVKMDLNKPINNLNIRKMVENEFKNEMVRDLVNGGGPNGIFSLRFK